MAEHLISLGDWEIVGFWLRPTRKHLEAYAASFSLETEASEALAFKLHGDNATSTKPLAIHKSRLLAVEGPLKVLANGPFVEASTLEVNFNESRESFDIIRMFLYLQSIDMRTVPPSFVLVADRWGLTELFEACFRWAELSIHLPGARTHKKVKEFILTYLPIIAAIDVPPRFKNNFALRLALGFHSLEDDDIASVLFPMVHEALNLPVPDPPRKKGKKSSSDLWPNPQKEDTECPEASSGEKLVGDGISSSHNSENEQDTRDLNTSPPKSGTESPEIAPQGLSGIEVWEVFRIRGMLRSVIHYLAMYGNTLFLPDIVDVIMHVLEPRLDEQEVSSLLKLVPWYQPECMNTLYSQCSERWTRRAWRLLALRLVNSQSENGSSISFTTSFDVGCVWTDNAFPTSRLESEYYGHKVETWVARTERNGQIRLRIKLTLTESESFVNIKAPRVCTVQDGCSCGFTTGGQNLAVNFKYGDRFWSSSGSNTFTSTVVLMSVDEICKWRAVHTKKCGLLIRVLLPLP